MKHVVIFEHRPNKDGRGACSACVPDLPGCVSRGATHEECEAKIRAAIELYETNLKTTAPASPGDHAVPLSITRFSRTCIGKLKTCPMERR